MSPSRTTKRVEAPEAILQAASALSYELDQFIRDYQNDPAVLHKARQALAECVVNLKHIQDDVERFLLQCLGKKKSIALPGGFALSSKPGTKEVVDQDRAVDAYAAILSQHSFDTKSGEVMLAVEHARRIVETLLAIMNATKPSKQALKAHAATLKACGINAKTIYSDEATDPKVVIQEIEKPKVSHPPLKMVRGGDAA